MHTVTATLLLLLFPLHPGLDPADHKPHVQAQWRTFGEECGDSWRDGDAHVAQWSSAEDVTTLQLVVSAEVDDGELSFTSDDKTGFLLTVTFHEELERSEAMSEAEGFHHRVPGFCPGAHQRQRSSASCECVRGPGRP